MKALIVVDPQLDFFEGGSLAVAGSNRIIPIINKLTESEYFDMVIFTKDWHPANHEGFASQHPGTKPFDKYWPTLRNGSDTHPDTQETLWPDHCVQDTLGAEFHPDLDLKLCKKDFYIFKKGIDNADQGYSGFRETGLKEFLDERGVTETYITGLAGDFCCAATAIDSAMAGFDTYFILDAIKFINPDISETINKLKEANVIILESWVLPLITLI